MNFFLLLFYNLQNCQLYGPTNFAPIITQVAGLARAEQLGSKYYVLLMITDGEITGKTYFLN